jgi:hypothetical protein
LVGFHLGQDAGQHRPRLILRGRKSDLVDHLVQGVWLQADASVLLGEQNQRELLRVDALDVRLEAL